MSADDLTVHSIRHGDVDVPSGFPDAPPQTATTPDGGGVLRAGWAVRDVTPTLPFPLGGYEARTGPAQDIHDPLEARALSLHHGNARAILLIVDLVDMDEEIVEAVRTRLRGALLDTPELLVWVAATHTHAGPAVGRLLGSTSRNTELWTVLNDTLLDVALDAARNEREVEASWASAPIRGVATNRDHPDRETDMALDLLVLTPPDSVTPAAILGSAPVHPTVLGSDNVAVSADLSGAFRRELAQHFPPSVSPWIALATGAAGDISTRHTRRGQDFDEVERLGTILSRGAWDLLQANPAPIAGGGRMQLQWVSQRLALSTKEMPEDGALAQQEHSLREAYQAARTAGRLAEARTIETALQGIGGIRRMLERAGGPLLDAEVGTLRLGSLALVSVPGELYSSLGAQLRAAAAGPLMVVGYANGYVGYLPPVSCYGESDYEALITPLAKGAGERVVQAISGQLHALVEGAQDAADAYADEIVQRARRLRQYRRPAIRLAGQWVADTVAGGGIVYTIGTGHSHLLCEEIFFRAGGLLPVQPLQSAGLMLHEDALASSDWERLTGAAAILLEHSRIRVGDVLFVVSNSGRNALPVEAAEWARERGIRVIAVTSLQHSASVSSRAPSGKRLYEVADLLLDNGGDLGDALVETPGGMKVGASSTVLGALILQSIVVTAIDELERRGIVPPTFQSANVPGADTANATMLSNYRGRLPDEFDRLRERMVRQP